MHVHIRNNSVERNRFILKDKGIETLGIKCMFWLYTMEALEHTSHSYIFIICFMAAEEFSHQHRPSYVGFWNRGPL